MSFVKNNSKLVLSGLLAIMLAVAGVFLAVFAFGAKTNTTVVNCIVYSTDDGNYINATNGGRVIINGAPSGVKAQTVCQMGQTLVLNAEANAGYAFAGYFDEAGTNLLSNQQQYALTVGENTSTICAKFAKLYPLTVTLQDPFNQSQTLTINKLCWVGQSLSTYDLVDEFYGADYAEHFKNSVPFATDGQSEASNGFVLAQSAIVVGAQAANISILPSNPTEVGVLEIIQPRMPTEYLINGETLIVYSGETDFAPGLENFELGNGFNNADLTPSYTSPEVNPATGCHRYKVYHKPQGAVNVTLDFQLTLASGYACEEIVERKPVFVSGRMYDYLDPVNHELNTAYQFSGNAIVELYIKTGPARTVTFYKNSTNILAQEQYAKGSSYSMPDTLPTQDGLTFAGWTNSHTSDIIGWSSGTQTLLADTSWYPVWKKDNTLQYAYITSNGAVITRSSTLNPNQITYYSCSNFDTTAVNFNIDKNEHYKTYTTGGKTYDFIGFTKDPNNITTLYRHADDAVDDGSSTIRMTGVPVKLYAVYRNQITVSYDPTWSNQPISDTVVTSYKIATNNGVQDVPGSAVTLPNLDELTTADFRGWFYNGNLYQMGDVITVETDVIIEAKWLTKTTLLSGSGTESSPYIISDADDFDVFMSCVNEGGYAEQHFKLTNSFVIGPMMPVGSSTEHPFKGVFDGNGQELTYNLNWPGQDKAGLFGTNEGTIKNLTVRGSVIGGKYTGGIVGYNKKQILNCHSYVSVTGGQNTGGIAGYNEGQISDSQNHANVSGKDIVGGIAGYNKGQIINCQNHAQVASDRGYVGGIAGKNEDKIDKAYNFGQISVIGEFTCSYFGGIAGENTANAVISNSINEGSVGGDATIVGGLAGLNNGKIANALNLGDVEGTSKAGGLVGEQKAGGSIINAVSLGNVQTSGDFCGAVMGSYTAGQLQYVYYYANMAKDGGNYTQKGHGHKTRGNPTDDEKTGVQSFNLESANAIVETQGGIERTLLEALNLVIAPLSGADGVAYCQWAKDANNLPTIFLNGNWNETINEGEETTGWTGLGTRADPYQIGSAADLNLLSERVNIGITYNNRYFKVTYNIDFAELDAWTPIGGYNDILKRNFVFQGTFDGSGKTMSNFNLDYAAKNYVALFGMSSGTISNVVLKISKTTTGTQGVADVVGKNYVAGLVAKNEGTIQNCSVIFGKVKANGSYVGAICAENLGVIERCQTNATVSGMMASDGKNVGGLVGINKGQIRNSFVTGAVNAANYDYVAGIAGKNEGRIVNCFNQGSVNGKDYVGGIAGQNFGASANIQVSYSSGSVQGTNYVGGVTGQNSNGQLKYNAYQPGQGASTAQLAIGDVQADTFEQAVPFNAQGNLTVNGFKIVSKSITNLETLLNLAQQFYNNQESGIYLGWSSETNNLPTIFANGKWNASNFVCLEGYGTKANPFLINNQEDLENFALSVNTGNTYAGRYVVLTNDINANYNLDNQWIPIGIGSAIFAGTFDGRNCTISNLTSNRTGDSYQGFFGQSSGTIMNVALRDCNITGGEFVGGIVGLNSGKVQNCWFNGTLACTTQNVGGIAGGNTGSISMCHTSGTITCSGNAECIGGLVGTNNSANAEIINSFSTMTISAPTCNKIGGIAGENLGKIANVNSNGETTGGQYVGGLVGENASGATLTTAYHCGHVSAQSYVGGVVGRNSGTISNTFYQSNEITDGNGVNQKGVGNATSGSITTDNHSMTAPFAANGTFSSFTLTINSTSCSNLASAMTAAWTVLNASELDKYCRWGGYLATDIPNLYSWSPADFPLNWNYSRNSYGFEGLGTQSNPYILYNAEDLKTFAQSVKDGNSFKGQYIRLGGDIDLGTGTWTPIGETLSTCFAGHFDGMGRTISNITINGNQDYQGLFGYNQGIIQNLTLNNCNITARDYIGGIAGFNSGLILNCTVTNIYQIKGRAYVGGIAGSSSGRIEKCVNNAPILSTSTTHTTGSFGGIVGQNSGQVITSYSAGNITASNRQKVGGVVGNNLGKVFNCYSTGDVSGRSKVGGVVGLQNAGATVINCMSSGNQIHATSNYVGGVVGHLQGGKVEYSYYKDASASASAQNGGTQGGIGQEGAGTMIADQVHAWTAFNNNLRIASTNIGGKDVNNLLDALNAFIILDRQNGNVADSWKAKSGGGVEFAFVDNVWQGVDHSREFEGTGTKNDPYKISSGEHLNYLRIKSEEGENYSGKYFELTNDIYLNSGIVDANHLEGMKKWTPISNFAGVFDGQGYAIHGAYVTGTGFVGIFGEMSGIISNLAAFSGYILGYASIENTYVGGIVARKESGDITDAATIKNCINGNTIYCENSRSNLALFAGGITGINTGIITSCQNFGDLSMNILGNRFETATHKNTGIGGIAGSSINSIINCSNKGNISTNLGFAGGIIGVIDQKQKVVGLDELGHIIYDSVYGSVENCFNVGDVSGIKAVAGIAGVNNGGTVNNSYSSGLITGANTQSVGGIVGQNFDNGANKIFANYYLMNSVNIDGINGLGVGDLAVDNINKARPMNQNFELQFFEICGNYVNNVVDALNAWAKNNVGISGLACVLWEMGEEYPIYRHVWDGRTASEFKGEGTEDNPYKISTAAELAYLAQSLNDNNITYFGKYFELTNDIYINDETFVFDTDSGLVTVSDGANMAYLGTGVQGQDTGFSGCFDANASVAGTWYQSTYVDTPSTYSGRLFEWTPIGNGDISFSGTFNGNGFTVHGVYINNNSASCQGLFGKVNGVIKNLAVANSYVCCDEYAGGIVGYLSATMTNVASDATVLAKTQYAGGLVGHAYSSDATITNAINTGIVWSADKAGAFVGQLEGNANNMYNNGTIKKGRISGGVFGETIGTYSTSNVYSWGFCANVPPAQKVNATQAANVEATLNGEAGANNLYSFSIDRTTGAAKFIKNPIWDEGAASSLPPGVGTLEKPYIISTAEQLVYFVQNFSGNQNNISACLANDIYMNDETFTFMPDTGLIKVTDGTNVAYLGTGICGDQSGTNARFDNNASTLGTWYADENGTLGQYAGTLQPLSPRDMQTINLDGAGHTIFGVYSNQGGFINQLTDSTIQNLNFANGVMWNGNAANVGAFANTAIGATISNCSNANILLGQTVGGIFGKVYDARPQPSYNGQYYTVHETLITNCTNSAILAGSIAVGGMVGNGEFISSIENCQNLAKLYGTGNGDVGGIVGKYGAYIDISTSYAQYTSRLYTISNSHNYGELKNNFATSGKTGGIVGSMDCLQYGIRVVPQRARQSILTAQIENCLNFANIQGANYVGGIVGYASATPHHYNGALVWNAISQIFKITNCINYGNMSGVKNVGGIAGYLEYVQLSNLENHGAILGTEDGVGGMVGFGYFSQIQKAFNDAFNYGNVQGANYVGGIAGYWSSNPSSNPVSNINLYNFGTITGTDCVGGLVGYVLYDVNLSFSHNAGKVFGKNYVGGIVGYAYDMLHIQTAYVANVVEGDEHVGGIVGGLTHGRFENCKYPYGLIKANLTEYCWAFGETKGTTPTQERFGGASRFDNEVVSVVYGSVQVEAQKFLKALELSKTGLKLFVIENTNSTCLLDGTPIVPSEYGINPRSEKAFILAYKPSSILTLDLNGIGVIYSGEGWNVDYSGQKATKSLYLNTAIGYLPTPLDEQYVFAGWFADRACLGQQITEFTAYDFKYQTLYAKWEIGYYTITLDTEGLCEFPDSEEQLYGWTISTDRFKATKTINSLEPVGNLPELTRTGFVFDGWWYTDSTRSYKVIPANPYWSTVDTTITPRFIANSIEISICLDGTPFKNSGITIQLLQGTNTDPVYEATNVTDSIVIFDQLSAEDGVSYTIKVSAQLGQSGTLVTYGTVSKVVGTVNVVIEYYSLTLLKTDNINSVYIMEKDENNQYVPTNKSSGIYLKGQVVVIGAQVAAGATWSNWTRHGAVTTSSSQQQQQISMNETYIVTANGLKQ